MDEENCTKPIFEPILCKFDENIEFSEKNKVSTSEIENSTTKNIQKRQRLSIDTKIQVIKDAESGRSHRELAGKYNCGKTQIGRIIKEKEELLKEWATSPNRYRKRRMKEPYEEVNRMVWEWYQEAVKKELPINGPILQAKAKEYAALLELSSFGGSNGWLDSFRKRHGIFFSKGGNKENSDGSSKIGEWKSHIATILKEYSPKDIYNIHETKLLFRAVPTESILPENELCESENVINEHLSIMLCCNALGEKENLLIVFSDFVSSFVKEIDAPKLGIKFYSNEKAWVTEDIFKAYLQELNEKMKLECRRIVLFTGDITCHLSTIELSHIAVKLLPTYSAALSQPLDLGIINSFKLLYRKKLLRALVARINDDLKLNDVAKQVNIGQAIKWVVSSWTDMEPKIISKCFKMSGIMCDGKPFCYDGDDCDAESANLCKLAGISNICKDLKCFNSLISELEVNSLPKALNFSNIHNMPVIKTEFDEQESLDSSNFSPKEGLEALCKLRKLFRKDFYSVNPKLYDSIDFIETELEDIIIKNKLKALLAESL